MAQDSWNSYTIQVQLLQLIIHSFSSGSANKLVWMVLGNIELGNLTCHTCSVAHHALTSSEWPHWPVLLPTALHNAPSDSWPYEESTMWRVKSGRLESKQIVMVEVDVRGKGFLLKHSSSGFHLQLCVFPINADKCNNSWKCWLFSEINTLALRCSLIVYWLVVAF